MTFIYVTSANAAGEWNQERESGCRQLIESGGHIGLLGSVAKKKNACAKKENSRLARIRCLDVEGRRHANPN